MVFYETDISGDREALCELLIGAGRIKESLAYSMSVSQLKTMYDFLPWERAIVVDIDVDVEEERKEYAKHNTRTENSVRTTGSASARGEPGFGDRRPQARDTSVRDGEEGARREYAPQYSRSYR